MRLPIAALLGVAALAWSSAAIADSRFDRMFAAAVADLCEPALASEVSVAAVAAAAENLAPTERFANSGIGTLFPGKAWQYRGSKDRVLIREAQPGSGCTVVGWARLSATGLARLVETLEARGYRIGERATRPTGALVVSMFRELTPNEAIVVQISRSVSEPVADASVFRVRKTA